MSASDRVEHLHFILLENEDEAARARAHLELSLIALRERRSEAAVRHLKEALALDAHLSQARQILSELGVRVDDVHRPHLLARLKARWGAALPPRLRRILRLGNKALPQASSRP